MRAAFVVKLDILPLFAFDGRHLGVNFFQRACWQLYLLECKAQRAIPRKGAECPT